MENQELNKEQNNQEQEIKVLPREFEVKVNLDYPIESDVTVIENGKARVERKVIKELVFKRLQGIHLRSLPHEAFSKSGDLHPSAIIPLVAFSTGIELSVADQIDLREMDKVTQALVPFLPKSL